MDFEAVLLTGGSSRRMGTDKALLRVGAETLEERLVRVLLEGGSQVTVLGPRPVAGAEWQRDEDPGSGPLRSLAAFKPTRGGVFVGSCDILGLHGSVPAKLFAVLGGHDCVLPTLDGRAQPLCGMYTAQSFAMIPPHEDRVMSWVGALAAKGLDDQGLRGAGIDPLWVQSANTTEEFAALSDLLGIGLDI